MLAIRAQEDAGLDIITDGEIRRESYSNHFATALDGVDIDNPGEALDRSGHPNPVPRGGRPDPPARPDPACADLEFLRAHTDRTGQGHRARPVHDVAAGAGRLLRRSAIGRAGVRRGVQRGGEGPVRGRRRHRAARRALPAGPARAGPRVRAGGAEPGAGRRRRHDRGAHLLRLRRDHPRAAVGLLVPARAGRLPRATRSRSRRRSPTWTPSVLKHLPGKTIMLGVIDLSDHDGRDGRGRRRAGPARPCRTSTPSGSCSRRTAA